MDKIIYHVDRVKNIHTEQLPESEVWEGVTWFRFEGSSTTLEKYPIEWQLKTLASLVPLLPSTMSRIDIELVLPDADSLAELGLILLDLNALIPNLDALHLECYYLFSPKALPSVFLQALSGWPQLQELRVAPLPDIHLVLPSLTNLQALHLLRQPEGSYESPSKLNIPWLALIEALPPTLCKLDVHAAAFHLEIIKAFTDKLLTLPHLEDLRVGYLEDIKSYVPTQEQSYLFYKIAEMTSLRHFRLYESALPIRFLDLTASKNLTSLHVESKKATLYDLGLPPTLQEVIVDVIGSQISGYDVFHMKSLFLSSLEKCSQLTSLTASLWFSSSSSSTLVAALPTSLKRLELQFIQGSSDLLIKRLPELELESLVVHSAPTSFISDISKLLLDEKLPKLRELYVSKPSTFQLLAPNVFEVNPTLHFVQIKHEVMKQGHQNGVRNRRLEDIAWRPTKPVGYPPDCTARKWLCTLCGAKVGRSDFRCKCGRMNVCQTCRNTHTWLCNDLILSPRHRRLPILRLISGGSPFPPPYCHLFPLEPWLVLTTFPQ